MRLIASIYAYDVMSSVHVNAHVMAYPDDPEAKPSTAYGCTTTVLGTGETDPRQWLVDALVGLLEAT